MKLLLICALFSTFTFANDIIISNEKWIKVEFPHSKAEAISKTAEILKQEHQRKLENNEPVADSVEILYHTCKFRSDKDSRDSNYGCSVKEYFAPENANHFFEQE